MMPSSHLLTWLTILMAGELIWPPVSESKAVAGIAIITACVFLIRARAHKEGRIEQARIHDMVKLDGGQT